MAVNQGIRKKSAKQHRLFALGSGPVNYWITFVSDPLTVVFLAFWEAKILRSNFIILVPGYVLGLLSWTLIEYVGHRWLYHKGRTPAHAGHKIHHQSPEVLIAMPWFVVTIVFLIPWYFFAFRLLLPFISIFLAGLLTGFVLYGAFHHIIHHRFNFKYSWYRKLKAQHFIHHQFPNVNFGVTSRFWDHVFGTTFNKESKKHGLSPAR